MTARPSSRGRGRVLRYSEMFYSLQGEGRFVGVPSVFLRTFGCNLRCHGFGQGPDPKTWLPVADMPFMALDTSGIRSLDTVPVPALGCDSSASWSARYKHLSTLAPIEEVARALRDLCPGGQLVAPSSDPVHLIITGGEPLLGWQPALAALLADVHLAPVTSVTVETNGTQMLDSELAAELGRRPERDVTWSVSPKLSGSGEAPADALCPDALRSYRAVPDCFLYVKYVVASADDVAEAERVTAMYRAEGVEFDALYLMPVGATLESYSAIRNDIAELAKARGFRFSPRLHVELFGNRYGT